MIRKHVWGFTLVELALVIVLIGIFAGLGLGALGALQTNRAFSETRKNQEKIKDALVGALPGCCAGVRSVGDHSGVPARIPARSSAISRVRLR